MLDALGAHSTRLWVEPDPEILGLRRRLAEQVAMLDELRSEASWLTDELIARDAAAEGLGDPAAGTEGAPTEWRPMLRAIRRFVHEQVPQATRLAVVSSGVEALLKHAGYRAQHLSQDRHGNYTGEHPGCALQAIVQLEAARWRGADALLIPSSELWWLENYPEFARHLDRRYARIAEDEAAGVVWSLRDESPLAGVHDELDALCGRQRRPAILDWQAGHDLASRFPEYPVFSPLGPGGTALPYLTSTVDVVAISDASPERLAEAIRVASTVVVQVDRSGLEVLWRSDQVADCLPQVSIVVAARSTRPAPADFVDRLLETLPVGFAGNVVLDQACVDGPVRARQIQLVDCPAGEPYTARVRRCAALAQTEVLVVLDAETWPTPGWLRPLVEALRSASDIGFVTGTLAEPSGIAVQGDRLDSARRRHVRRIDPAPARFFAARRAAFSEWADRAGSGTGDLALAYSGHVRARGGGCVFEPESIAIAGCDVHAPGPRTEVRVA